MSKGTIERSANIKLNNLCRLEGRPSCFLADRTQKYFLGKRRVSEFRKPDANRGMELSQMPPDEQVLYLAEHEAFGFIGKGGEKPWCAVPAKNNYSPYHVILIPTAIPARRNLQCDQQYSQTWNGRLSLLFRHAGYAAHRLLHDPRLGIQEIVVGINGKGNKSLEELLHVHFVGIDPRQWIPVDYNDIPKFIPRKAPLFMENLGCADAVCDIASQVANAYPDIVRQSFVVTRGASAFIELKGPLEEIAKQECFPDFIISVDQMLRNPQKTVQIPDGQQCIAIALLQPKEHENALLAFQLAAKIGELASGCMETAQYALEIAPEAYDSSEQIEYLEQSYKLAFLLGSGFD